MAVRPATFSICSPPILYEYINSRYCRNIRSFIGPIAELLSHKSSYIYIFPTLIALVFLAVHTNVSIPNLPSCRSINIWKKSSYGFISFSHGLGYPESLTLNPVFADYLRYPPYWLVPF